MTDEKLAQFGRDARYMCSPYANVGKPPREEFVIQLREAREEWRRRFPKLPISESERAGPTTGNSTIKATMP